MSKLSRLGWGSLAALFLATAVISTVLIVAQFSGNSPDQSNLLACASASNLPNQQPKNGRLKGAQLADFQPPQKIGSIACIDYKVGSGAAATSTSLITVNYVGALASSGTIFDDSFDSGQAFTTNLSSVIPGWSIGLPGMKTGGVRRLFIPASLAYGSQSLAGIPANSDLVFDVQLVDVK